MAACWGGGESVPIDQSHDIISIDPVIGSGSDVSV